MSRRSLTSSSYMAENGSDNDSDSTEGTLCNDETSGDDQHYQTGESARATQTSPEYQAPRGDQTQGISGNYQLFPNDDMEYPGSSTYYTPRSMPSFATMRFVQASDRRESFYLGESADLATRVNPATTPERRRDSENKKSSSKAKKGGRKNKPKHSSCADDKDPKKKRDGDQTGGEKRVGKDAGQSSSRR